MSTTQVCFAMKRFSTPFIEGYTIGSRNLIRAACRAKVRATVISAEPLNCPNENPGSYRLPTLFAENLHVADLITASYMSLLPSLGDYDIIHFLPNLAGDLYASFTYRRKRKSSAIIVHFSHPYEPYIHSPFSDFRLTVLCRKVLDYVFCISNFLVEYFHKKIGIERSKVFCIPFPIDTDKYRPLSRKKELRKRLGLSGEYIVAFTGQIESVRGAFVLLKAFNDVLKCADNVKLVVTNPGLSYENANLVLFEKMIKKLDVGDAVVLLNAQKNLEEIYNLADAVVFPYTGLYYYMDPPLTLLEAMSSGAFVIASKVGNVSNLILDGENGKLVKPKSVTELSHSILDTMRDHIDGNALGYSARKTILSKYSMEVVGKSLAETYDAILRK